MHKIRLFEMVFVFVFFFRLRSFALFLARSLCLLTFYESHIVGDVVVGECWRRIIHNVKNFNQVTASGDRVNFAYINLVSIWLFFASHLLAVAAVTR